MSNSTVYDLFMKDVLQEQNTLEYWINNASTYSAKYLLNGEYYYLRKEKTYYILSDDADVGISRNSIVLSVHGKKLQIDNFEEYMGKLSSYLRESSGLFAKQKATQRLIGEKAVKINEENRYKINPGKNSYKSFYVETGSISRTYYYATIPTDVEIFDSNRKHTDLVYKSALFLIEKRDVGIYTDYVLVDIEPVSSVNIFNALDMSEEKRLPKGLQLYLASIMSIKEKQEVVFQRIYDTITNAIKNNMCSMDEFWETCNNVDPDILLEGQTPLYELIKSASDETLRKECACELLLEMVKEESEFVLGQTGSLRELKKIYRNMDYNGIAGILKDYYILQRYLKYANSEVDFWKDNRFYLDRLLYIKRLPREEKIRKLIMVEDELFEDYSDNELDALINSYYFLISDKEREGHRERALQAGSGTFRITKEEMLSKVAEGKYVSLYNFRHPERTGIKILKLGSDGRVYVLEIPQLLGRSFHNIDIEREADDVPIRRHSDDSHVMEVLRRGLLPFASVLTNKQLEDVLVSDTGEATYTVELPDFLSKDIETFWQHEKKRVLVKDNDENMMKLYKVFKIAIARSEPITLSSYLEYIIATNENDTSCTNHYIRIMQNREGSGALQKLLYNISYIKESVLIDEKDGLGSRIHYKIANVEYKNGKLVPCNIRELKTELVSYTGPEASPLPLDIQEIHVGDALKTINRVLENQKACYDDIKSSFPDISFTDVNLIFDAMYDVCDINSSARDYFVFNRDIRTDATIEELYGRKCPYMISHEEGSNVLLELLKQSLWINPGGVNNHSAGYSINEQDAPIIDIIVENAEGVDKFVTVVERTISVLKEKASREDDCLYSSEEVMERLEKKVHQLIILLKPGSVNVIDIINNMYEACVDENMILDLHCFDSLHSCFYKNDEGSSNYNGGYGDIYKSDEQQPYDEAHEEKRDDDFTRGRMSSYWD